MRLIHLIVIFGLTLAPPLAAAGAQPTEASATLAQEPPGPEDEEEEAEQPPPPPTEEEVAAALEDLAKGLERTAIEDRIAAVRAAGGVPAEDVVEALSEAAAPKDRELCKAVLDVLGRMEFEPALAELRRLAKRSRELKQDDELTAELYKAIGRSADPEDLKLFCKHVFQADRPKTTRACLLSIARVRTDDALEDLIDLMNRAPIQQGKNREKWRHWADLHLALHVVTGANPGSDRPAWQAWWNDNKKSFSVSEESAELDRKLGVLWNAYWRDGNAARPGKGKDEGNRR